MNGAKRILVADIRDKLDKDIDVLEALKNDEKQNVGGSYLLENYRDAIMYLGAAEDRLKQIVELYDRDVEGGADA